jgi:UDP-N-acetylmuramoyl-L-alanyl-D-glutamate--2,6-diaminopimelate ligase
VQLEGLAAALGPARVLNAGAHAVEVADLAYDTRAVGPGALFFCVRGAHADGHELAGEAVARGAVALVVERPLPQPVPQLVVADSRRAMAPAAVELFGDPSRELAVAAVTGTAGKTTTAYLLHAILSAGGRRPGLLTNLERRVGAEVRPAALNTPEAIDLQRLLREMVDAGDGACVMEATSHASAQGRLDGVSFAVLVFTNLAHEHLDFHGSMEAYFAAKRRLFAQAETAVVNAGDEWGRRLAAELPDAVTFDAERDRLEADLALPGRFNLENALAAAAAARALGVGRDAIREGIEAVRSVPGRFEFVDEGQPFAVIVDYAHKPASLERVLDEARRLARGRVVCVFGCGGDRDREKRPVMGRIAAELADVAIVTSDNPRSEDPLAIIEEIVAGAPDLEVEPDRRDAIAKALEAARPGDVVLVAGKGHEQGQEIAGVEHPFDDREVARELLRALAPA